MKKFFVTAIAAVLFVCADVARKPVPQLAFDSSKGVAGSLEMPTGQTVHYTAYTKLYYVTNVEDTTYQYMNVYVPDGATQQSPIFLKNNIGGYMPSAPGAISAGDATGMALLRGYVVAIPGVRRRSSYVTIKKKKVYNGKAPAAILDQKAAVRYLRHFDKVMPGDANKIISNGTFAPLNGGQIPADMAKNLAKLPKMPKRVGEYITDLDMPSYLNYVANKTALKSAPAFDALGVAGDEASGENDEFGDAQNNPANFTEYSAAKNGKALSEEVKKNEKKIATDALFTLFRAK